MLNNSKAQNVIDELCQKLQCSELADDLQRVSQAREMLEQLQQIEIFKKFQSSTEKLKLPRSNFLGIYKVSNILLEARQRLDSLKPSSSSSCSNISDESKHSLEEEDALLPEEEHHVEKCLESDDLAKDTWLGYFRGYEILEENQESIFNANKQCVELFLNDDGPSICNYLRAGVCCFMIDLFIGTEVEKQKLIFKLRESELKMSREFGFPITTTLCAMLSPRLQYTGQMAAENPTGKLKKGDKTILTVKKKYSSICNCNKIYVNACFLIGDCRKGDFILVGPSIQLIVTEVFNERLECKVMESGQLFSRMPVRFPARCQRLELSLEELENITFANKVGINILVTYKSGPQHYLHDLYNALRLLKCDNLRTFTRVILNEYEGDQNDELEWIAERYDGFFVDFSSQLHHKCCHTEEEYSPMISDILNLSPAAINFMTKIYKMKKPIVLNPRLIAECRWYVPPCNIPHVFYYPDKFLFSQKKNNQAFFFNMLQNALTAALPLTELSKQLYCDSSELGDETIARACVTASWESQAKAIIVCSSWPDMSIKLSHFRPKVPILQVSAVKSIGEYISLYHNIVFMNYQLRQQHTYAEYVINAFLFCVIYLKTQKNLHGGDNIVLVYSSDTATKLCDKYLVYKFNEKYFASTLEKILFV